MKQTVQLQRVETRTVVLEVLQPLTAESLRLVANGLAQGIGSPGQETQISHSTGTWKVLKATPGCECQQAVAKKKGRG